MRRATGASHEHDARCRAGGVGMKLTKPQIKAHKEACALIDADRPLKDDEREFILDNWQEAATHINSAAGAFFTPRGLARDFAIEVDGGRCIDLCAGIGSLAYAVAEKVDGLVCIEVNPEYARVGRRIVPEAEWIVCSVFDPRVLALGRFRWAISNPPFGKIPSPDYFGPVTGADFEYRVMEIASRIADAGCFILPQMSASFRFSGQQGYRREESDKARKFREQTGIEMEAGCGVDTAFHRSEWRGVSPICEIVLCEFDRPMAAANELAEVQADLFGVAA